MREPVRRQLSRFFISLSTLAPAIRCAEFGCAWPTVAVFNCELTLELFFLCWVVVWRGIRQKSNDELMKINMPSS